MTTRRSLALAAVLLVTLPFSTGPAAWGQSAATSPALSTAVSPAPPEEDVPGTEPTGNATDAAITTPSSTTPNAPAAAALPAGSGVLDSATVQRIIDRLVSLHFLTNSADAQDPEAFAQAIREFQSSAGISPSGTLDRDTIGRLTTP